jgi:hypothetical protein
MQVFQLDEGTGYCPRMRRRTLLSISILAIMAPGIVSCGSDADTNIPSVTTAPSGPSEANSTDLSPSAVVVDDTTVNAAIVRLDEVALAAGAVIEGPELDLDGCPLPSVIRQLATNGFGTGGGIETAGIRIDENNATELGCLGRSGDGEATQVWGLVSFDISQTQQVNQEMSDLVEVTPPAELGGSAYHGADPESATAVWIRGGIIILIRFRTGDSSPGTNNTSGTAPTATATPESEAALQFLYAHIAEWLQEFAAFDPFSVNVVTSST